MFENFVFYDRNLGMFWETSPLAILGDPKTKFYARHLRHVYTSREYYFSTFIS